MIAGKTAASKVDVIDRRLPSVVRSSDDVDRNAQHRFVPRRLFVGGTGTGLIAVAAGMYPTAIRSTGIGWAMGMGRVGQVFGPILTGVLVGFGYKVGGIFYAAAVPCLIGALFLIFLYFARPVMEADAEGSVAPAK